MEVNKINDNNYDSSINLQRARFSWRGSGPAYLWITVGRRLFSGLRKCIIEY